MALFSGPKTVPCSSSMRLEVVADSHRGFGLVSPNQLIAAKPLEVYQRASFESCSRFSGMEIVPNEFANGKTYGWSVLTRSASVCPANPNQRVMFGKRDAHHKRWMDLGDQTRIDQPDPWPSEKVSKASSKSPNAKAALAISFGRKRHLLLCIVQQAAAQRNVPTRQPRCPERALRAETRCNAWSPAAVQRAVPAPFR
jgi:hypothetical protein